MQKKAQRSKWAKLNRIFRDALHAGDGGRGDIAAVAGVESGTLNCMDSIERQLKKADRLSAITQRVGFALWQIQELESVTAQYFVLVAQSQKGMGLAEGEVLIEKAQAKTFGSTIHQIIKARLMDSQMEMKFNSLLAERNWLVHRSRIDNRKAVHDDFAMNLLNARLDAVANEATALLKIVGDRIEIFVRQYGVSAEYIDSMSMQILEQWHRA